MNDPLAIALGVAEVLERRGLRYLVGGSLASSISGEPRSTLDVDIVVAMTPLDVDGLVNGLRPVFDVDERAVARAVRERSSVNVFHVICSSWACHRSTRSRWIDGSAYR